LRPRGYPHRCRRSCMIVLLSIRLSFVNIESDSHSSQLLFSPVRLEYRALIQRFTATR
jgi:hypothetical protein